MTDTFTIKFSSDADPSNNKTSFTLTETEINNTATSLTLHGKNAVPFGEDLWTNLVHLLENFYSSSGPNNSTLGQLWFDSTANALKVRRLSSTAPFSPEWALVSPFNGSSNLTVPLVTSLANNDITGDTSDFDNYFVTKSYSDTHYLPRGNFVPGADALSKYKIKYSTDVSFGSGDTTALVTKKYVDDLVGVSTSLHFTVQVDGSMVATTPLLGSLDNSIPAAGATPSGNLSVYDNYFVTRGYADQRYLREGVFDNDNRRISVSKIQYNSDAIYSAPYDDYTLVHKLFVTDYVASEVSKVTSTPAWLNVTTQPSLGVLWSDGNTPIKNIPIDSSNTGGQVLAINSSKNGFEWITPQVPNNAPNWVTNVPTGVMVGNGSIVNGVSSTSDKQILATTLTGSTISYEWKSLSDLGLVTKTANSQGFLYSDGTNLSSSYGGHDTVLTINSTGIPEWVLKSTLGGSGTTPSPTPSTQKWRNESENRKTNILYTNNTGFPILISVDDGNIVNEGIQLTVDGVIIGKMSTTSSATCLITDIIPAGSTYKIIRANAPTAETKIQWRELTLDFSGSSISAPSAGVVTSNGTTLSGTSYGTNNYLLASSGTGLKWVDPSTIGGGTSSTVNSNAIATTNPGPVTFTSTKASNTTMYDGYALPNGYNMSGVTQLLSLKLPDLSSDTLVSVTVGGTTAKTGTALTVIKMFADVNGTNIRSVSEDGTTFIITVKAGGSYTLNLMGQYHTALGVLSGAGKVTASNVFIEALAVGGTLSSSGSGSTGAVRMVKNTVSAKSFTNSNTPVNLVSVTIPASPTGTTVEYWVTLGFSHINGYTINDGSVPDSTVITVKDGSSILYNFDSIYTRFYSAAFSVTVSSTPKTLTLAIRGVNCDGDCINNYITATPITSL